MEPIIEGACGPASQAHTPEPIHQLLQDPPRVSSQWGCEQASQDAPRLSPNGPLQSPIARAQPHLIMEDGTLALPVQTHSDSSTISDVTQHGPCHPRLQVQVVGEGKAPSKVLVGWGKGSSIADQMAPLGTRKSRWLPYFPSGEDRAAIAQGPLPAPAQVPAQVPAQGQGQGKCPCPAQATASSTSLPPSTPARATTPVLDVAPMPVVIEPYTCTLGNLTDTIAITKNLSQDLPLRKCGNQWSVPLESSKMGTSCQDKVSFQPQEESLTPPSTPVGAPDHVQEHKVTRRQTLPKQPEKLVVKLLVGPCNPTPGPELPGTPKPQRIGQEGCNSQPDQQPLNICNNTYANVPLPTYQGTCHRQPPVESPREAVQIPPSSAPTCQLREAMEDRVLVFDMATGNTRMGLLCHDPMGSQAVLVGVMPNRPSIYIPENTQSLAMPIHSPDNNRSSFWSTTPMLSSPVPSSLSSGSYREVALLPKEARIHLESQNSPGTETPIRVGMLTGPIPLAIPLQFGERILTHVPNPGWSKPDAEKNEPSHTIWVLDTSRMPDASMVQTKKLQWINSEQIPEPAPPANPQEVPRTQFQEDMTSHNRKEVTTVHLDNPLAEGAGKSPLTGQHPLAEQPCLARKIPPAGQPLLADQLPSTEQPSITGQALHTGQTQPPSTKEPPLPGQLPLTGQPLLTRQVTLTGQPPFSREPLSTKDPPPSKASRITREPGQASTLCQEGESLGLPTQVRVLQVPLAPEETCIYVSREKVSIGATQSSSMHQLAWHSGSPPRAQEEQLSLITFTTPGTGCKVLPMTMVGTEPQGTRLKMTAEDITQSSVVARLGLLHETCNELVSTMDALPVQSPVICRHSLGTYQDMAAIVIDTGTGFTKCGLAGENHVLSVVPSRVQLLQHSAQGQPRYVVPENQEGSYPVLNRGVISDWDALEVLWQHLFYCRLGVQPEELAVLVADSPISPRTNREKVAEILFERFHVPAMQTVHQALLALYAYGRTTGLVLGSGYGTSYVAPILTGDLAPPDTYRLDVAGCDLTEYLAQLLLAGGHSPPKAGLVNQIKEASCYVTMDMAAEMACTQAQAPVDFVLPDKQVITLGSERFRCPEALFQPSLLGLSQPGLPQLALLSISRLEAKQQEQLLANVVLDGGSTMLNGFPERLRQELGPRATVLGSPHRAIAAWLGGSIMASRDSFQSLWLSRREYEEEGPWAIYKYHL
ncbi:proline-rich protein 36-like [Trichechus manatus latirostris]|uniref:Proline-rich protein 36-like n=1 Tax=Trichechus manatus latirostris TaxID=127582 RepID=A0A2Y9FWH2_TRIMA|nr:proline-rich protein 36-like [Trichechus manatus latirostris]